MMMAKLESERLKCNGSADHKWDMRLTTCSRMSANYKQLINAFLFNHVIEAQKITEVQGK